MQTFTDFLTEAKTPTKISFIMPLGKGGALPDIYDKNTKQLVGYMTREFLLVVDETYTTKNNIDAEKVTKLFTKWVVDKNKSSTTKSKKGKNIPF